MNAVILVVLAGAETAARLLAAARAVADRVPQARIEALVVRFPAEATILPTEQILTDAQRGRWEAEERARAAAIEAVYRSWVAGLDPNRVSSDWIDIEGLPAREIADRGRRADLIVLDRPPQRLGEPGREALHAALFESGRPVLVAPPEPSSLAGRRIAIAWREDGRAIGAVIAALRYFADAQFVVLIGYRGAPPSTDLPPALVEHGVEAKVHLLPIGDGPFGEQLLAKAAELEADLIVAGAYAHSPLREMLLGGVTRHLLAHAETPVLMRH